MFPRLVSMIRSSKSSNRSKSNNKQTRNRTIQSYTDSKYCAQIRKLKRKSNVMMSLKQANTKLSPFINW